MWKSQFLVIYNTLITNMGKEQCWVVPKKKNVYILCKLTFCQLVKQIHGLKR